MSSRHSHKAVVRTTLTHVPHTRATPVPAPQDVASSTVLDVAVWPDMVWVNDRAAGVRLVALAVVLRK